MSEPLSTIRRAPQGIPDGRPDPKRIEVTTADERENPSSADEERPQPDVDGNDEAFIPPAEAEVTPGEKWSRDEGERGNEHHGT